MDTASARPQRHGDVLVERRALCRLLSSAALITFGIAEARSPAKTFHVGVLAIGTAPGQRLSLNNFEYELARLGLVKGVNLVINTRYANSDPSLLESLAAELVALRPDLILAASGTAGALAAKKATRTIPIVFGAGDPVAAGLISSLAHPGGNLTGNMLPSGLDLKRLQILMEVLGTSAPLAVLSVPLSEARKKAFLDVYPKLGLGRGGRLQFEEVRSGEDLASAFEHMARERIAGVVVGLSPLTSVNQVQIAALAAKHRLAAIGDGDDYVKAGFLFSYSVDWSELDRRAAHFVYKILKGANPGDLPIEQVTKFNFVVNLKTARLLGVRIPQSLLLRADRVIE